MKAALLQLQPNGPPKEPAVPSNKMSFTPLVDTGKPSITQGKIPTEKLFALKMKFVAGEDLSNDGFMIALVVAVLCLAVFGYFFYTWIDKKTFETGALIGLGAAGVFGAAGLFFLIWWVWENFYTPDVDEKWTVTPADQVRVNAGHVGFLAFISFALYKLCGKRQVESQSV